jgi:hypothetical protein
MLILEIALGIVLGYLLLEFLGPLIGCAIALVLLAIVAALMLGVGALLMRLTGALNVGDFVGGIGLLVAFGVFGAVIQALYKRRSERRGKPPTKPTDS